MGEPVRASDNDREIALDLREAVLPGPDVDIEARAIFGGLCGSLGVRSKPKLVDQLKDSARRLAERLNEPRE
jgi:hypothetical protein